MRRRVHALEPEDAHDLIGTGHRIARSIPVPAADTGDALGPGELPNDATIGVGFSLGSIARGLELLHSAGDPAMQTFQAALQTVQPGEARVLERIFAIARRGEALNLSAQFGNRARPSVA